MNEIPKLNSEGGRNEAANASSSWISSNIRESVTTRMVIDLSALAKGFCESLETIRENGAKYRRIWLIRHFPLVKSRANSDYEKRSTSDKSKMPDDELERLREDDINAPADITDEKTQNVFRSAIRKWAGSGAVTLCVDSSEPVRVRNKMTQEWVKRNAEFTGKFHERPVILSVRKDADSWKNAVSSFEQVRMVINSLLLTPNESILVGNRSLAWAFGLRAGRAYVSAKEAARRFGETGYDFIDFENGNPEKIILADAEILRISPDNAKSVIGAFMSAATDEKEKAAMSEALASLPLVWLQEAVNAGFEKLESASPESYAGFLFSLIEGEAGKDADTQKFVFTKLVRLDGAVVRLLEKKWNSKIVEWMATKNYREFVIKYFGETEEGPSASAWMFSKSFQNKETEGLYDSACQYWKARRKQKRSVDPFVRKNDDVWVIPRIWHVEKAKSENGENSGVSDRLISAIWKISPRTFEKTVIEACRDGNLILSANVGKGKSIWISEFVKNAAVRWIPVRLFDARELTASRLAPGGDVFEDHANSWAIFCFDGIDEIRDQETKIGIKNGITKLRYRCVVTTRPGEFPQNPERVWAIWLDRVDFKTFVEARYSEDFAKKIIDYVSSLEIGKEIREDPLLMAFVCLLHENAWSLPAPEAIRTKSALFEAAARFVLSDHSKTTKWQDHDPKDDVDAWMGKLAEYAMEKSGGTHKTETSRYYDSHLSLLFRDDGTGNYEFVHESFYEFFLWYAITSADSPKDFALRWKKRHFQFREGQLQNVSWKAWRKNKLSTFRAVEALVQRSQTAKAEELASWFLDDPFDDPFWTSFFHGLELAWCLVKLWVSRWDDILRRWYEKIGRWTEMEVALKLSNLQSYAHRNGYPQIEGIDSNVIPKLDAIRLKRRELDERELEGREEFDFASMEASAPVPRKIRNVSKFVPILEWDSEFRIWTEDFPVEKMRVTEENARFKTLSSRKGKGIYEYEWNASQITVVDSLALWSPKGVRRACEYLNFLWYGRKLKYPLSPHKASENEETTDIDDSEDDLNSKLWNNLCRFLARNYRIFDKNVVLHGKAARKFVRNLWIFDVESLVKWIESVLEGWKDDEKLWAVSVNLLVRAYGRAVQGTDTRRGRWIEDSVDWKNVEIDSKRLLDRMGMDIADFLDDEGNVFVERLDEITGTSVHAYGRPSFWKSILAEKARKERERTKAKELEQSRRILGRSNRTPSYMPDDSEECAIRRLFPERSKWTGQKTFLHCDNNECDVMNSFHPLLEMVKSGDARTVLKDSLDHIQSYGLEY